MTIMKITLILLFAFTMPKMGKLLKREQSQIEEDFIPYKLYGGQKLNIECNVDKTECSLTNVNIRTPTYLDIVISEEMIQYIEKKDNLDFKFILDNVYISPEIKDHTNQFSIILTNSKGIFNPEKPFYNVSLVIKKSTITMQHLMITARDVKIITSIINFGFFYLDGHNFIQFNNSDSFPLKSGCFKNIFHDFFFPEKMGELHCDLNKEKMSLNYTGVYDHFYKVLLQKADEESLIGAGIQYYLRVIFLKINNFILFYKAYFASFNLII